MMKVEDVEKRDGVCPTCKDMRFVVLDVPYGHPRFGDLIECRCSGGSAREHSPFEGLELPDDVRHATFDTAVRLPQIVSVLGAARTLVTPPHGVLTLSGPPGLGKTMAAGCIINAARSAGLPALYARSNELFARLYQMTKPGAAFDFDSTWEKLLDLPVLCIDDLHMLSQWTWGLERLHALICSRYDDRRKRLTCLITNEGIDSWPDYVQSRVRDVECHLFELAGQDVRQRKR